METIKIQEKPASKIIQDSISLDLVADDVISIMKNGDILILNDKRKIEFTVPIGMKATLRIDFRGSLISEK